MRANPLITAWQELQAGNRASAQRLTEDFLQQQPTQVQGWLLLAEIHVDITQRRAALSRALELDPTNQRARQALAELPPAESAPSPWAPPQPAAWSDSGTAGTISAAPPTDSPAPAAFNAWLPSTPAGSAPTAWEQAQQAGAWQQPAPTAWEQTQQAGAWPQASFGAMTAAPQARSGTNWRAIILASLITFVLAVGLLFILDSLGKPTAKQGSNNRVPSISADKEVRNYLLAYINVFLNPDRFNRARREDLLDELVEMYIVPEKRALIKANLEYELANDTMTRSEVQLLNQLLKSVNVEGHITIASSNNEQAFVMVNTATMALTSISGEVVRFPLEDIADGKYRLVNIDGDWYIDP